MIDRRDMAVLVTGAAGFVGSHLAERLLALGHPVVALDNFATGRRENLAGFMDHPGFTLVEADMLEPGVMARLKSMEPRLSVAYHLAAVVSVPWSMDHPEETMAANFEATRNLLAEAETLGFSAFVFAGSSAEYGDDPRLPLREEHASDDTVQLSPYGRAKYLASRQVSMSPIGVSLRFFNIYGPRQDPSSAYSGVISRFIDLTLAGKPLTVFGDGSQSRDFVYVADCVRAYLAAAGLDPELKRPSPAPYNIGTGRATTILELAHAVQKAAGAQADVSFLPPRDGDILHSLADVSLFTKTTGWAPAMELGLGLKATIEAVKAQG